jgi:hypothetical protein
MGDRGGVAGGPVGGAGTNKHDRRTAVIEWMQGKLVDIQNLLLAGIAVAAIAFVAGMWWRTKQLVPTLSAFILAGAVVWGSANVGWFRDKIGKETAISRAPVVLEVRAAPVRLPSPTSGWRV